MAHDAGNPYPPRGDTPPMTDLGDRMLLLLIAGTGLGSLLMWWGGFVVAEVEGFRAYAFGALLLVIFLAALVLVWRSFRGMK